jgi:hypothetical protein
MELAHMSFGANVAHITIMLKFHLVAGPKSLKGAIHWFALAIMWPAVTIKPEELKLATATD